MLCAHRNLMLSFALHYGQRLINTVYQSGCDTHRVISYLGFMHIRYELKLEKDFFKSSIAIVQLLVHYIMSPVFGSICFVARTRKS